MLIDLLITHNNAAHEQALANNPFKNVHGRATRALRTLVEQNPLAHDVIANAGNPAAVVELLKAGSADAKDYALWSATCRTQTPRIAAHAPPPHCAIPACCVSPISA
jgi:hypothetical protein